ncbi:MAG: (2Fe-2S)-binding protein [Pseudomonadota bacterium]
MATLRVNGERVEVDAEEDTPLLWVLREQMGLTGTKYGCGIAQCGACTIHVAGQPVRACVYPLGAVTEEDEITTIEGLSEDASHPVQQAWAELDIPQCGFCQPGMIMAVAGLLANKPDATDEDINLEITNICRCGTLARVRKGIHLAKTKA